MLQVVALYSKPQTHCKKKMLLSNMNACNLTQEEYGACHGATKSHIHPRFTILCINYNTGSLAEWLKAHVWKTCIAQ